MYQLAPNIDLLFTEAGSSAADRVRAERRKTIAHVGELEDAVDLGIEPGDGLARHAGRRDEAVPRRHRITGKT